jgi:hypothetical protein
MKTTMLGFIPCNSDELAFQPTQAEQDKLTSMLPAGFQSLRRQYSGAGAVSLSRARDLQT